MQSKYHRTYLIPLTLLTAGCLIYVSVHSHSLINRCFGWTSITVIPTIISCVFVATLWYFHLATPSSAEEATKCASVESGPDDQKVQKSVTGCNLRRGLLIAWIIFGVAAVVLLVGTLAFYAYMFSAGARGIVSGTLSVSGLSSPVTIQRDADGVTHITASSMADLFFTQGYGAILLFTVNFSQYVVAVAQDRLWQLEFMRRAARGELAAALGSSALSTDILIRTLGIPFKYTLLRLLSSFADSVDSANESYVNDLVTGSLGKVMMDQYAAGINAYVGGTPALSPEFIMLNVRPAAWTGRRGSPYFLQPGAQCELRIAAVAIAAAWLVRGKFLFAMFDLAAFANVDLQARVEQLLPPYPTSGPTIVQQSDWNTTSVGGDSATQDYESWQAYYSSILHQPQLSQEERSLLKEEWEQTDATFRSIAQWLPGIRSLGASNGWVVSGAYTSTGKPLLANDPHLPLNSPNVWWMTHLKCTNCGFEVFGSSYVGLPGILIGRNRNIAWGLTMGMADEQDTFIMTENSDGTQYYYNNAWVPYTQRTETIAVKGASPTTLTVKLSRYGPVINNAFSVPGTSSLCLFWSSFNQSALIGRTIVSLLNATDYASFQDAFSQYSGASLSVVYADIIGNIGYLLAGRFPLRQAQHDGRYPVPGNGTFDYVGWLPFAKNPQTLNPAAGFIVAANNKAAYNGYPYNIGADWIPPLRVTRIRQRLTALIGVTPVTSVHMRSIQLDTQSIIFDMMRSTFAAIQPSTAVASAWQAATLQWDGDASVGSTKTGVFETWLEEMLKLPSAETGVAQWSFNDIYYLINLFSSTNATSAISDPACVAQGMTCMEYANSALNRALSKLGVAGSSSLQLPPWGSTVHATLFQHRVVSKSILGCLADRPAYGRGDDFTVSVAHCGYGDGVLSVVTDGPSYRQVIDLNNMENSVYVCPLCGTGNALADNYDSQLTAWGTGSYVSMSMDTFSPVTTLTLQ